MITSEFCAEPVEIDGFEGKATLLRLRLETAEHLGMEIPAEDTLEGTLVERGAQLESRLVAGADHAEYFGVLAREVLDRDRGGGSRAKRRQQVATDNGTAPACIGVEQEDRGLVVGEALGHITRPEPAGL